MNVTGAQASDYHCPCKHCNSHKEALQARLLAQLDHPFIIKHYCTFSGSDDILHIVMDYAAGGTVYHAVRSECASQQRMSEDTIWKWAIQLLLGVAFIHSKRIIHRDLKTLNLFLDANSDIKIGDFGIARALGDGTDMLRTIIGTPFYLSALFACMCCAGTLMLSNGWTTCVPGCSLQ